MISITEEEAQELARRAKKGDSRAFEKLWSATHNMVDHTKYFDPTGSRNKDDFLQVTRLGAWKAVNTWKEGGGSTIKSWLRTLMSQALTKELRILKRETPQVFTDLDQPLPDGSGTMEQIIFERLASQDSYQPLKEFDSDLFDSIIAAVRKRINYNRVLVRCFDLRLEFPDMERKEMAKTLGISKPALSHHLDRIRTNIGIVANELVIA
jgi:DNA-directed RNA polymerase specialized sigma24 family protein